MCRLVIKKKKRVTLPSLMSAATNAKAGLAVQITFSATH